MPIITARTQREEPKGPKLKSVPLAIGLNVLLPGLGYMYMGKALVGLFCCGLTVLLFLAAPGLFLPAYWISINVIMLIDMLILGNKRKAEVDAATTFSCPSCAEKIQRAAKVCRFCGVQLDG